MHIYRDYVSSWVSRVTAHARNFDWQVMSITLQSTRTEPVQIMHISNAYLKD